MILQNLKWTKNIEPQGDEPWAYQSFKADDLFKLKWRKNEHNANRPHQKDLILLRQHGYVTHLVKILDNKANREDWEGDFSIYRIVEVLWVIDWNHPADSTKANELFGYQLRLQGGNVMYLDMGKFRKHWQNHAGLTAFQDRVRTILNLPSQ
jgi:hypothetical protein